VKLIDAWRKDTGVKLEHPVPESWITDGVNPNLSATPPDAPEAVAPPAIPETTNQEGVTNA
jgi:hypothetical protein